ncbi:MAG: ATP-binding protein [Thermodesulfobacteriota bacterium]
MVHGSRSAVLAAALATALGALAGGCAGEDPRVRTIDAMELHLGAAPSPPAGDAGWQRVALPDLWLLGRRAEHVEGWYRARFTLEQRPDRPWAVYLPWVAMNPAVHVNGSLVGDGGSFAEPVSRNRSRPLLFVVPSGLLHEGDNALDVRLKVDPASPGMLGRLHVGPADALRPRWQLRHFFQVTVLQAIAACTLALALLMVVLYSKRDPTDAPRWFIPAIALWPLAIADAFVRDPPMSTRAWEWLGVAVTSTIVVALVLGFHRALRLQRRRLEITLVATELVAASVAAAVPTLYAFAVLLIWSTVNAAIGGYVVVLMALASRERRVRHPWVLRVVCVIAVLILAHDLASTVALKPLLGLWMTPYLASGTVLFTGWTMVSDVAIALDDAQRLNRELEQRVRDKHDELERNYALLRRLERDRAVSEERDRIMRDMHDGMGGQLVSTLALVESGRGTTKDVGDALRDALEDLRLVIDSLEPVEDDLGATLGMIRQRLEPRLERHGIRFDWQVGDLPALPGFGPERALQTLRVVQEAVTNAVKHAHARTVAIRTGVAAYDGREGVYVEVCDDGDGFDLARVDGDGRGLANMQRRAAVLGGRLVITSRAPTGTVVRLWLCGPTGSERPTRRA